MLTPGTKLQGRYEIVRRLAQGGMGTVYEAVDRRLDATVALKETSFAEEELRKQFEREARLLARLHHPALPRVSDHFDEGDGQFLVMQFIEGPDLEEMRRERPGGTFPPGDVLAWADQLLDALDYLHAQQPPVIHRDIKPQNLKLTSRGQIILLDFGLAKGHISQTSSPTQARRSVYGFTRAYAPLEQFEGTGTDPLSDLFSLAATLYHLLTGVVPVDVLARVTATTDGRADPLRPAHELNPQVPPAVSAILARAMSVARSQRPPSAAEMRRELQEAKRQQDSLGSAPTVLMTPTVLDAPAAPDTGEDELPFDPEVEAQADVNALTARQRHHLNYWTAFRNYVEQHSSLVAPPKPQPDYWVYVSVGRGGFALIAYNGMRDKWIGVELYLAGPNAKSHFHLLSRERERIEREVGTPLEWQEKPSQKTSRVTLKRPNVDPTDKQDWPRQHAWLLEKLEAFHRAFAPRIKNLRAGDYVPGAEADDLITPEVNAGRGAQTAERPANTSARPAGLPLAAKQSLPTAPVTPLRRRPGRSALFSAGLAALILIGVGGGIAALYTFLQPGKGDDAIKKGSSQPVRVEGASAVFNGRTEGLRAVALSPAGTILASGGGDGTVKIWHTLTGELQRTLDVKAEVIAGLAFSPEGKTLAVAAVAVVRGDGDIVFIDTQSWTIRPSRPKFTGVNEQAGPLDFSQDGEILIGAVGSYVKVWDAQTGALRITLGGDTNPVFALSPIGRTAALASRDRVNLWDTETGTLKRSLTGQEGEVLSLAFSTNGRVLATTGFGIVNLWDVEAGTLKQSLTEESLEENVQYAIHAVAFAPDGRSVASGGRSGVLLWDAHTGALRRAFSTGGGGLVIALAFMPDGKTLVCGRDDGSIFVFDVGG